MAAKDHNRLLLTTHPPTGVETVGSEVEADGYIGRWEMKEDMLIDDWDPQRSTD